MESVTGLLESALAPSEKLLIGAWVAPAPHMKRYNNKNLITDRSYRILRESGINCIYALYENFPEYTEEAFRALDYCKKYGIRYLVRDKNCELGNVDLDTPYFEKYIRHPACAGVLFADEPGISQFPAIRDAWTQFRKKTEDKTFYLNLLPVYAQNNQFLHGAAAWEFGKPRGTKEQYMHYIEEYLSVVRPEYISYDYYPMEGEFPHITADHFWQLSYIRRKTQERGIPFYCFIQCCTWNRDIVRNPSESEILWQVSSALLYGCRGIQYFTFLNPFEEALEGAQFYGNLMDGDGNVTEKMSVVKNINVHLNGIGSDIVNGKHLGIMGEAAKQYHVPSEDMLLSCGPLREVETPCIAGCFQTASGYMYYVMNPSLVEEAEARLHFCEDVALKAVFRGKSSRSSGNSFAVRLAPGEGVLVRTEQIG